MLMEAFYDESIVYRATSNDCGTLFDIASPNFQYKLFDSPVSLLGFLFFSFSKRLIIIRQTPQEEQCYEVLLSNELVVVQRSKSLSIYRHPRVLAAHPSTAPSGVPLVLQLKPFYRFSFQWNVDSARLAFHAYTGAIMILLRFNSGYPWPVNVLHEYCVDPNPIDPNAQVPKFRPPELLQTIPAPVRLFAISDMTLGPYGSVVWIDTHVEDYWSEDGMMAGQRLAGRGLPRSFRVFSGAEDPEDPESSSSTSGILAGVPVGGSNHTSVYGVREEDDWDRVAIDERGGLVAVSMRDGRVMLFSYA